MKEQKELIEAAIKAAAEMKNWPRHVLSPVETRLISAANAYRQAQEQQVRHKAPWTDSEGNELFEGDELIAADGTKVEIKYCKVCEKEALNWIVVLGVGQTWFLKLFISQNKAVKVSK